MKRIVCFINTLTSGGAEHQLTILSSFLAEKGYDVTLTTFGEAPDHYNVGVGVKRFRIQHNGTSRGKLIAIFKYFWTVDTDCVISFGSRENFFCMMPLLFRKKIMVLAGERCAVYKEHTWYEKMNYQWLYSRADFIIPNSYTQKNDINEHWAKYADKVKVITNYTDVDEYRFTASPHHSKKKIGVFCRYDEQKNYRRLAQAISKLDEKTKKQIEIHWYGSKHIGDKILPQYKELEDLIQALKISDIFFLHDQVKDVSQRLGLFDALCLASLTEGFSNSISEYICCGRPVLCSDVADNSVMVHDGKNGFLFNPEDVSDMVNTFERFCSLSEKEIDAMGRESRVIAESLFNKEKFVKSYIDLIEKIIKR